MDENPPQYEQLTLDLEWPVYEHYTVELRKDNQPVRSTKATTVEAAIDVIDGLRNAAESRDKVTWHGTEVDDSGRLFGIGPEQTVWSIHVVPDLNTELG